LFIGTLYTFFLQKKIAGDLMAEKIAENKDYFKILLAVIVIVICIFELIALGVIGRGGGGAKPTEILTGTTEFTGVIRTYDPGLLVTSPIDTATLNEIRAKSEVIDVTPTQDGMLIRTETRDDVYPLGVFLRQKNLTVYGVANIAPPATMEVVLPNGTSINATPGNVALRVVTEPLIDVDNEITIRMVARVADGVLVDYSAPLVVSKEKKFEVEGTVLAVDYIYTYSIPWKERTKIEVEKLSDYGEVKYRKRNTVSFNQPLTISEVLEKKNISYITYIDQYSIECDENFTDEEMIRSDFDGKEMTFVPSILVIVSNKTVDLNYSGELVYRYKISIPTEINGTRLESNEIELESNNTYEVGSSVPLEINGTVIGNKIVLIKSINRSA